MKRMAYVLLALLHHCAAHPLDAGQSEHPEQSVYPRQLANPQFVMDPGCTNLPNGAGNHIVSNIQDAIDMAANAVKVLNNKIHDKHVEDMCKLVLGEANFVGNVQKAKSVFEKVAAFDRTPSTLTPTDPAWRARASNQDVAIFCDASRLTDMGNGYVANAAWGGRQTLAPNTIQMFKDECYVKLSDSGGRTLAAALTRRSDFFNQAQYVQDAAANPQHANRLDAKYYTPSTYPNTIDVCTWYWQTEERSLWPTLETYIHLVQKPQFLNWLKGRPDRAPIDYFAPLSGTMLHELTHTNQGGSLIDADAKAMNIPGVDSCYYWRCVTKIHMADNPDTVGILGKALYLFTKGYYVNAAGEINKI